MQSLSRNGLYSGAKQQIDVLDYEYYPNSNKIKTITDEGDCPSHITIAQPIYSNVVIQATDSITLLPGASISGVDVNLSIGTCDTIPVYSKGFVQRSTGNYAYDANGNLVRDPNKKVTITYNHLNLPETVEWYDDGVSKMMELLYDAEGTKLQKVVKRGSDTLEIKDYFGGIEYTNDTIEAIYHMEGRAVPDGSGGWLYEYCLKDHTNNARVLFTDSDGNGEPEIIGKWSHYPFGLNHQKNDTLSYQFNGLENISNFGLDINLAEFRTHDPTTGRWWQIDPLNALHYSWSPYNQVLNNPTTYLDPLGLDTLKQIGPDLYDGGYTPGAVVTAKRPEKTKGQFFYLPRHDYYAPRTAVYDYALRDENLNQRFLSGEFGTQAGKEYLTYAMQNDEFGNAMFDVMLTMILGVVGPQYAPTRGMVTSGGISTAQNSSQLLLSAPKFIHKHHILPQQFRSWFMQQGITNIDDYTILLSRSGHLKGVHGKGLGNMPGKWNKTWSEFIKSNPSATPSQIFHQAETMLHKYGLEHLKYVPYK